jgi:glycosyltransferase involved in cell wall biosynthesis
MPTQVPAANAGVAAADAFAAYPVVPLVADQANGRTDAASYQAKQAEIIVNRRKLKSLSEPRSSVVSGKYPNRAHGPFAYFAFPFALIGTLLMGSGLVIYFFAILVSITRFVVPLGPKATKWVAFLLWWSGAPTTLGILLVAFDLLILFPMKRRSNPRVEDVTATPQSIAVALTCYNDEQSIGLAVSDFLASPLTEKVIVVDNNSKDRSAQIAREAGAEVFVESQTGYGSCVYRCYQELLRHSSAQHVVLCEGDMTFRARDLEKLTAFAPHADIVNGTRIVEQLRARNTQLTTAMYYGNFFMGKLLELKHLGRGTFTDVGTTYKLISRSALQELLKHLDPRINLEFNAHFLDIALSRGFLIVECPITFHARIGRSKGGNIDNFRALAVGLRMILGLLSNWKLAVRDRQYSYQGVDHWDDQRS